MRLLRGRGIDCGDLERAESIVVVNEALVRARGGQAADALHADVHRRWARHAGVGWSERRDHELCRALQDIPACAGEPASRALRSLIFRVHLRGRGVLLLQIAHFLRLAEPLTLSSGVSATRMVHSPACGVLLAVAPASAFLIFVCAARSLFIRQDAEVNWHLECRAGCTTDVLLGAVRAWARQVRPPPSPPGRRLALPRPPRGSSRPPRRRLAIGFGVSWRLGPRSASHVFTPAAFAATCCGSRRVLPLVAGTCCCRRAAGRFCSSGFTGPFCLVLIRCLPLDALCASFAGCRLYFSTSSTACLSAAWGTRRGRGRLRAIGFAQAQQVCPVRGFGRADLDAAVRRDIDCHRHEFDRCVADPREVAADDDDALRVRAGHHPADERLVSGALGAVAGGDCRGVGVRGCLRSCVASCVVGGVVEVDSLEAASHVRRGHVGQCDVETVGLRPVAVPQPASTCSLCPVVGRSEPGPRPYALVVVLPLQHPARHFVALFVELLDETPRPSCAAVPGSSRRRPCRRSRSAAMLSSASGCVFTQRSSASASSVRFHSPPQCSA